MMHAVYMKTPQENGGRREDTRNYIIISRTILSISHRVVLITLPMLYYIDSLHHNELVSFGSYRVDSVFWNIYMHIVKIIQAGRLLFVWVWLFDIF